MGRTHLSFFGSRFMNKPDSLFENAGFCKCMCTLFWFGLCMCTAKSISVAWPLREHICGEDSTSGSHIFSHHCCSHCKRVERKENKLVKEKETLLQQRDNKYSFTHHFPLLNQSFLSDLAFRFFTLIGHHAAHVQLFIVSYDPVSNKTLHHITG